MHFEHTVLVATKFNPASSDCLTQALAPFQDPYTTLNFDYCKEYSIYDSFLNLKKSIYGVESGCLISIAKRRFGNLVSVLPFSQRNASSSVVTVFVADDQPSKVVDIIVFDNPNKKWSKWKIAEEPKNQLITKNGASPTSLVSDLDIKLAKLNIINSVTKNYNYLQQILPLVNREWVCLTDMIYEGKSSNKPIFKVFEEYFDQDVLKHVMLHDVDNVFFNGGMENIDDYCGDIASIVDCCLNSMFIKKSFLDARDVNNPKWIDCCKSGKNIINFDDVISQLNPDEYLSVVNCQYRDYSE